MSSLVSKLVTAHVLLALATVAGCATHYRELDFPGSQKKLLMVSVVDADIIDKMRAAEPTENLTARCNFWKDHPEKNYWRAEKGTRDFVAASSEGWCKAADEKKQSEQAEEEANAKAKDKAEQDRKAEEQRKADEEAAAQKKAAEDAKKKPGGKKK